tara:strand:- start:4051 stop:4584 length:534 start_codon:yes stop_codon:yes gene_type:complete
MRLNQKGKQYGEVIFKASKKLGVLEEVFTSLTILRELLKKDALLRGFFNTRQIDSHKKATILDNIMGNHSHPIVSSLFEILLERGDHMIFSSIYFWFKRLRLQELDILQISVFSSDNFDEAEIESIRLSLESFLSKNVIISAKTDPSLIGGIKLRMGNLLLDGTIRGQLDRIKNGLN